MPINLVSNFLMDNFRVSRRNVLKLMGASGLALYLRGPEVLADSLSQKPAQIPFNFKDISPFDSTYTDVAPRQFFGDNPMRVHPHLWNSDRFDKEMGTVEKQKLVVVGGGLSGLMSAYLLRDLNPIVLEQADRFGGNAKGQFWKGIKLPFGSAYVTKPAKDSELYRLYADLGVDKMFRFKKHEEPIAIDRKVNDHYWDQVDDRIPQWKKLDKYFADVFRSVNGHVYPDIPAESLRGQKHVYYLDQFSFKDHLEKNVLKEKMHPEVHGYFDYYFLGAFSAKCDEISAAAGINFYAAEEGFCVLPGGNGTIAEVLMQKIRKEAGDKSLRANQLVVRAGVNEKTAFVKTLDLNTQKLTTIECDAVVMSCPKFVVGRILQGIEPERLTAIKRLQYRSYLVANVLFKKYFKPTFYETILFRSQDFKKPIDPKEFRRATDIVHGDYLNLGDGHHSALSLYRPIGYDGARAELIRPDSYEPIRKEFETQINNEVLPIMKLTTNDIVDLRIFRIGHAMPLSAPGLLREHVVDKLRKPFKGRMFFIEQDNWALPSFETSAGEAFAWAPSVRKLLQGRIV